MVGVIQEPTVTFKTPLVVVPKKVAFLLVAAEPVPPHDPGGSLVPASANVAEVEADPLGKIATTPVAMEGSAEIVVAAANVLVPEPVSLRFLYVTVLTV